MLRVIHVLLLLCLPFTAAADRLTVGTVTRLPFSMVQDDIDTGFSIELWQEVISRLDHETEFVRHDQFGEMLSAVTTGLTDAAIANISITAERELVMDFSQPIFSAGLQIMIPQNSSSGSVWRVLTSPDVLLAIFLAFGLLFAGGMLMWVFERKQQPYFEHPAKQAMFPAFWWALNLVVNGGFEERMPRSAPGRVLGVFLVISSLFVVSIFVAKITSVMTVEAITSNVNTVDDLYGKQVATIRGSTAARFLDERDIAFRSYDSPDELFDAFESDQTDAVVFDAPILAYYVNTSGKGSAELAGPIFQRESYGIALPGGSDLREEINRTLLNIREDGTYARLHRKWFGSAAQ